MNMTAQIIGVSTQTIMRWIRLFHQKFANPVQHVSHIEEIEVDEMFSYLGKKKNLFGSGKLLIITLENSSDGNVVIVAQRP